MIPSFSSGASSKVAGSLVLLALLLPLAWRGDVGRFGTSRDPTATPVSGESAGAWDIGQCAAAPSNASLGLSSERIGLSPPGEGGDGVLDFTNSRSESEGGNIELYNSFIVTFREYKHISEHKATFSERLDARLNETQRARWNWVDRNNVAVNKHPTDFGLVSISDDSILPHLRGLDLVKGVFADRKVSRRKLQSASEEMSQSTYEEVWEAIRDNLSEEDELVKGPGRLHTPFSSEDLGSAGREGRGGGASASSRRRLAGLDRNVFKKFKRGQINSLYKPEDVWKDGHTGKGIRVGIFDTGVRDDHPDLRNIELRTNWTFQQSLSDGLGHGSFVAGCVASINRGCPSVAPDAHLYTFKVFTDQQESFTSWYLDALNYALIVKVHIINVSIGGPDYTDTPFVDKFREVVATGVILMVAMGNNGPNWGTANNPGDEHFAIGVGGHTAEYDIANFQVRGMTIQEAPVGYGRIKPDVVAYGEQVASLRMERGCREMSGTSVAAPVASGLATLLASTVPENERYRRLTPASMKQVLMEGADRLPFQSIYVQGPGVANLNKSYQILKAYQPRVSVFPPKVDLMELDYMWPHSRTPLYASAMPLMLNLTVTNGLGVTGRFKKPPTFIPTNELGEKLYFHFEHSDVLWPWSGYLAIFVHAKESCRSLGGKAEGKITFTIASPPFPGETEGSEQEVTVPFIAGVIPTPERSKRVLWDDYHNIQYPPHYIPIDNLDYKQEILDWNGDHPHTNFHPVFDALVNDGYHVEVLGSSATCYNASNYGTLVLCDTEGEFHEEEMAKIDKDVREGGMGLVIIADWYNKRQMQKLRFFDDNTRNIWTAITGGSNVPGLNRLLRSMGIVFSSEVTKGRLSVGSHSVEVKSGTSIAKFPPSSTLFHLHGNKSPVLGLTRVGKGNVLAFCDTNAFDINLGSPLDPNLFLEFVEYAAGVSHPSWIGRGSGVEERGFENQRSKAPSMTEGLDYDTLDKLKRPLKCHTNAALSTYEGGEGKEEEAGAGVSVGHGGPPTAASSTAAAGADSPSAVVVDGTAGKRDPNPVVDPTPIPSLLEDLAFQKVTQNKVPKDTGSGYSLPTPSAPNAYRTYYQRQVVWLFAVLTCLALLLVWKRVSAARRSRARATKNRYARLRQIV